MLYDSSTARILYLLDWATSVFSNDDAKPVCALEVCRIVCSCTDSPCDGKSLCARFKLNDIE